jgi:hypothetical protein
MAESPEERACVTFGVSAAICTFDRRNSRCTQAFSAHRNATKEWMNEILANASLCLQMQVYA